MAVKLAHLLANKVGVFGSLIAIFEAVCEACRLKTSAHVARHGALHRHAGRASHYKHDLAICAQHASAGPPLQQRRHSAFIVSVITTPTWAQSDTSHNAEDITQTWTGTLVDADCKAAVPRMACTITASTRQFGLQTTDHKLA